MDTNIASGNATHIADADKQGHPDGALRRRRKVIADNADNANERSVQTRRNNEEEGICKSR